MIFSLNDRMSWLQVWFPESTTPWAESSTQTGRKRGYLRPCDRLDWEKTWPGVPGIHLKFVAFKIDFFFNELSERFKHLLYNLGHIIKDFPIFSESLLLGSGYERYICLNLVENLRPAEF